MGPLQCELVALIRQGHTTPRALLQVLSVRYSISPETIRVTLLKLTQRGVVRRRKRGVYEVA